MIQALTNKWFILRSPIPSGGAALSRGKILGPLSEFLPIYLVQVMPSDPRYLTVDTQSILSLEDLRGANLYDSEILMLEDWRSMLVQIQQTEKEIVARQRRSEREAERQAKKIAEEISAAAAASGQEIGVEFVPVDPGVMEKLFERLKRQRGRRPAEPPTTSEDDE